MFECVKRAVTAGLSRPLPAAEVTLPEAQLFVPVSVANVSQPAAGIRADLLWARSQGGRSPCCCRRISDDSSHGPAYLPVLRVQQCLCVVLYLPMCPMPRAGERCSIDCEGQTVPVINQERGEVREVQRFVASGGTSSCTCYETNLDATAS